MSYIAKYVIYKVIGLLLDLVVETSNQVSPHVQVSGAYPSPKWIRSYKHMIYAKNITSLVVTIRL